MANAPDPDAAPALALQLFEPLFTELAESGAAPKGTGDRSGRLSSNDISSELKSGASPSIIPRRRAR